MVIGGIHLANNALGIASFGDNPTAVKAYSALQVVDIGGRVILPLSEVVTGGTGPSSGYLDVAISIGLAVLGFWLYRKS